MYAYLYLKTYPNYTNLNVVAGNFSFKNLSVGLLKVSKRINGKYIEEIKIDQNIIDEFELQIKTVLSRINNNSFIKGPHVNYCEWCNSTSIFKK